MADIDNKPTRRVPRWIKIALGLSLAVNFAVMGMVAGAMLRGGPKGPPPSAGNFAFAYVRALPREDRREIFEGVRRAGGEGQLSRADRRALYTEMLTALRAPDLDRNAVSAVLDKQNVASVGVQSAVQIRWLDLVEGMSIEERSAYADAVQEVITRGHKRHKNRKP